MKPILFEACRRPGWLLACVLFAPSLLAADFDSGSTGNYGPMNITASTTLDMPADGVFHCTTITVAQGATLRFNRNALNTPVVLLATGDVSVAGAIDVSGGGQSGAVPGKGGPGGFDGGYGGNGPAAPASRGGDGHGPGGGVNAPGKYGGVYAVAAGSNTRTYGNVLITPLVGGSGAAGADGNPGWGGSGGGGAILIASNTRIVVNGYVQALSGFANYSLGGSGGAIRLVAPTGGGNGNLDARSSYGGGDGRVRVDCTDVNAFRNLTLVGRPSRGSRMFVFPPSTPKLHIIEAAGQVIPVGSGSAVSIELPAGSPASQTVKLRGEGFTGIVPVQIVVVSEHSASTTYNVDLNGSAVPAEVSTTVTLPVGELATIEAWVR